MMYLIGYTMVYHPQVARITYRGKLNVTRGFAEPFGTDGPTASLDARGTWMLPRAWGFHARVSTRVDIRLEGSGTGGGPRGVLGVGGSGRRLFGSVALSLGSVAASPGRSPPQSASPPTSKRVSTMQSELLDLHPTLLPNVCGGGLLVLSLQAPGLFRHGCPSRTNMQLQAATANA